MTSKKKKSKVTKNKNDVVAAPTNDAEANVEIENEPVETAGSIKMTESLYSNEEDFVEKVNVKFSGSNGVASLESLVLLNDDDFYDSSLDNTNPKRYSGKAIVTKIHRTIQKGLLHGTINVDEDTREVLLEEIGRKSPKGFVLCYHFTNDDGQRVLPLRSSTVGSYFAATKKDHLELTVRAVFRTFPMVDFRIEKSMTTSRNQ